MSWRRADSAQMRSEDLTERTWACAAVCNLIQNDPATRRLFQGRNVVGLLIERLSDDVIDVVVEASGALRYVYHYLTGCNLTEAEISALTEATSYAERCSTRASCPTSPCSSPR